MIKPVVGFEGLYEVSDTGHIYSLNYRRMRKRQELAQTIGEKGYVRVVLSKNKTPYTMTVHRIVADAFLPPSDKPTINHKNGVTSDNRVDNLEWATHSENHKHAFMVLGKIPINKGKFGGENHAAKSVTQISKSGEIIKVYGSLIEAGKDLKLNPKKISRAAKGKIEYAYGFKWVFT